MKANNSNFEALPVAALSDITTGGAMAVIINTTGEGSIFKALQNLYCHSHFKVYYIEPGVNQLRKTLELCSSIGLRSIVLTGSELPKIATFAPESEYSATLISAGSDFPENNILDYILSDEKATSFSHVGYQIYKYHPGILSSLREKFFEEMRLGSLRGNIGNCEPLMRNSTCLLYTSPSPRD